MRQENNFEFIEILPYPIGFWVTTIKDLDCDYWINQSYEYKKSYPESVFKSNKGGWQSNDDIQLHPSFHDLTNSILSISSSMYEHNNYKIDEMWINISSFGCYNSLHSHGPHFNKPINLSGVLYLKVPKDSGNIVFYDPFDLNRFINFSPEEKMIIIFPDQLLHMVEPNLNQEEDRISIAFNYG